MSKPRLERGFTIVEIAVVLVIVGLLLAGFLGPLGTRIEQAQRQKTMELLEVVKEALLGFAAIHGYLPCPTTENDPNNPNYGLAATSCPPASLAEDAIVPWATLGVSPTDAWGRPRTQASDRWVGYWRYRVDRNFADSTLPITLCTPFSAVDRLQVEDPQGHLLTPSGPPAPSLCPPPPPPAGERPIAIVYSAAKDANGDLQDCDGQNRTYDSTYTAGDYSAGFDDIVIWIARPLLFNRMIASGQLP
ncbi:MAG: prepilin-type N-terminal cleavage/methylation domain-containing protein [bacterium]